MKPEYIDFADFCFEFHHFFKNQMESWIKYRHTLVYLKHCIVSEMVYSIHRNIQRCVSSSFWGVIFPAFQIDDTVTNGFSKWPKMGYNPFCSPLLPVICSKTLPKTKGFEIGSFKGVCRVPCDLGFLKLDRSICSNSALFTLWCVSRRKSVLCIWFSTPFAVFSHPRSGIVTVIPCGKAGSVEMKVVFLCLVAVAGAYGKIWWWGLCIHWYWKFER